MLNQQLINSFKLSEDQKYIIENYHHGFASVLATPGSGKTTIISYLICKLIEEKQVDPRKILVLTLTDSAAREFKMRATALLKNSKRYPEFSTIHSFCNRFLQRFYQNYEELTVLPEPRKNEILEDILINKGFRLIAGEEAFISGEIDYLSLFRDEIIPIFRKDKQKLNQLNELLQDEQKDIRTQVGSLYKHHLECLYHIPAVIEEYEEYLQKEKFLDFDMMINETYHLLKEDHNALEHLQEKYDYILEDEAQDSNYRQNMILELLASKNGNYIRVGDPNQSIFSTFTGADYESLMSFYRCHTQLELKQSNRSHQSIINIANYLVDYYPESFPSHHVKIKQGEHNPNEGWVSLHEFDTFEAEIEANAALIEKILQKDKQSTLAVLTRTNLQALHVYRKLTEMGYDAKLHGNREDNFFNNPTVVKITIIIGLILFPHQEERLLRFFNSMGISEAQLNKIIEDEPLYDSLQAMAANNFLYLGQEKFFPQLCYYSKNLFRLLNSIYLSVSEILEMINNLFISEISEKNIARILHQMWLRSRPGIKNISNFYTWLIKHAESRISQSLAFDHENYTEAGLIHILTIHKAKGLQWDAVFLPNFSNWDFKDDSWHGPNEKKDIRSIILALLENQNRQTIRKKLAMEEVRESRRVAYVGLTRARKYLSVTCAHQGINDKKNKAAEIYYILKNYLERVDEH